MEPKKSKLEPGDASSITSTDTFEFDLTNYQSTYYLVLYAESLANLEYSPRVINLYIQ